MENNYHKSRERVVEEREHMVVPEETRNRRHGSKRNKTTGVTQEELAELCGISLTTIQNIEQGFRTDKGIKRPVHLTQKTAKKLAKVFGVRAEYLLCVDDYRTEAQLITALKIQFELEENLARAKHAEVEFNVIIQTLLRQGQEKGNYFYDIQSSTNSDGLNYVISNGVVTTILDDSYLDELREDVLAYFSFKLNRDIHLALIKKLNKRFNQSK